MSEKSTWSGKTRGGLLGYKIFHFILETFGVGFAYFILYFVAFYFLIFGGKATKANYAYFRNVLGLSPLKAIQNVYHCYYNFGQAILDKVAILSKKKHPFTSNSNGLDNLYNLVNRNEGGILISAHLGNWEIAGHFLNKLQVPINIVLFDGEHERIKAMLKSVMVEKKFNVIAIKEDFSHIIAINRALKAKEFICIHGDRFLDPEKSKKMALNFLGKEAFFPMGPFSLVSKMKVPHCFVYAVKTSNYHYELFAFEGKVKTNKVEDIMKDYVSQLEEMVIKYPRQWYNFYPFWKG